MIVQAKNVLDGHPSGYIFDRLVKAGEIFEIPDTLVPHWVLDKEGKQVMAQAFSAEGVPLVNEKGDPIMKPVKQVAVTVGARGTGPVREYSEKERRELILAKNAIKGITPEERELYLKYLEFAPAWMKVAPKKSITIHKEVSSPESDVSKLGTQDAMGLINKTLAIPVLNKWLELEEEGQKRENIISSIKAQLRTASGR